MKKPLNIKTHTILQNGNKHLSKSKNSFFHEKRDVITLKDDVITQFMIQKKFRIRPTTPTEYFCSTSPP